MPSPYDADVAVEGRVRDLFSFLTDSGPLDFEFVYACGSSDAENHAGVVRGEIAAAAGFQARTFCATSGPEDLRSDGITIAGDAFEEAEPVVASGGAVLQQQWGSWNSRLVVPLNTLVMQ
jgi:hypothetical protein